MIFLWRGFGIIVPILFFICAWIVSFWFEDTKLGNPIFIGWACFYTGIILSIIGLGTLKGTEEEQEDGSVKVKKHDFFFLPLLVWGLGLVALCIYLLLFTGVDEVPVAETAVEDVVAEEDVRTVNFYNNWLDTLRYTVIDANDDVVSKDVLPGEVESLGLGKGNYIFATFEVSGEFDMSIPNPKSDNAAAIVNIGEGDEAYAVRKYRTTPEGFNGYDEAWVMLSGFRDFVLLDVTSTCYKDATYNSIQSTDWMANVIGTYNGNDLMEVHIPAKGDEIITVLPPRKISPNSIKENERVLALVPVHMDSTLSNQVLVDYLLETYFD